MEPPPEQAVLVTEVPMDGMMEIDMNELLAGMDAVAEAPGGGEGAAPEMDAPAETAAVDFDAEVAEDAVTELANDE